jgi:hypothetical protein
LPGAGLQISAGDLAWHSRRLRGMVGKNGGKFDQILKKI